MPSVTLTGPIQATAMDTALQVKTYERKLRQEAVPHDPITGLMGVHSTSKRIDLGNEIYMKIDMPSDGQRTHVFALSKALSGEVTEGSTTLQTGREEELAQKFFTAYYNDVSHAVSLQSYGIEAKTKSYYQIFEEITPKLGQYAQELWGKYAREALLQCYSHNLTAAGASLTQEFTPNIAVANVSASSWPTYNSTAATYVASIGTALNAAGTSSSANVSVSFLQTVEEYASTTLAIEPVEIGGKETYVLLLPSNQARILKSTAANGLAALNAYNHTLTTEEMSYPGVVGRIGRLLICEDPRYPTITLSGSTLYSMAVAYRLPGMNGATSDPRDKSATARQVGFLLGKGALCEWKAEDWHWEYQYADYDKFGGKGIFASAGIQQVRWNKTGGASADLQQNSSMALIFAGA